MDRPYFTVIITTYRREQFLGQALESVHRQDFTHYECLIINDDPERNSSVAKQVAAFHDSRFQFIESLQNRGANYCRNKGIRQARGEYIAFLDDDDIWFPEKLAQHYERHQSSGAVLVYSDYVKKNTGMDDQGAAVEAPEVTGDIVLGMFNGRFSIGTTSSVTLRREGLPDPLFDEDLVSFQDWDAWLTIARQQEKVIFSHIQKPLLFFVQHTEDRTSKNSIRREKGLNQLVRKYGGKQNLKGFYDKELMNVYRLKAGEKKSAWIRRTFLLRQFIASPGLWFNRYAVKKLIKYVLLEQ